MQMLIANIKRFDFNIYKNVYFIIFKSLQNIEFFCFDP